MATQHPGTEYVKKLHQSVNFLKEQGLPSPEVVIILGSGLSSFVESIEKPTSFGFAEIPNYPTSTVEGHENRLFCGKLSGKNVAVLQGRVHLYEGYSGPMVAFAVRSLAMMGSKYLIVTNAAGGLNPEYDPGDLVNLTNLITFYSDNPSCGVYHPELGPLFYDVTYPFDFKIRELVKSAFEENGVMYKEGIYALMRGSAYETAADIQALKLLGADLVGMSTVPEVLAARQFGIRVVGISLMTNLAAGLAPTAATINHEEVIIAGKKASSNLQKILRTLLTKLPN